MSPFGSAVRKPPSKYALLTFVVTSSIFCLCLGEWGYAGLGFLNHLGSQPTLRPPTLTNTLHYSNSGAQRSRLPALWKRPEPVRRLSDPACRSQNPDLVPTSELMLKRPPTKTYTRKFVPDVQRQPLSKMDAAQMSRKMSQIAQNPDLLEVIYAEEYIPEDLRTALEGKKLRVVGRSARVVGSLGSFIAKALLLYSAGNLEASKPQLALELKQRLIDLGPSFVKFGQALSTRPDVTPPEFIEVLQSLQDRLPSFPDTTAMELLQQELGKSIDSVFSEVSTEPIAAASLGQVYRGRLRSGEEVAIKIQRPEIAEGIAIDMLLLRRLTQWVDENINIGPLATSVLTPLVDEFAARLFGELDYEKEGRSAERFAELYCGKKGLEDITCPKIYWEATTRRVLTMEWIDGVKLTEADKIEEMGFEVINFVDKGVQCTLRQLLEQGFFHADPHPGNLLVTRQGKLAYIDFGMMSTIPERARYALIAHVVHLVNRDYEAMCNDYYDLDFMSRDVDTRPIAPALANFFDDALGYSVSELNFGSLIDGLGEVFFEYPFQLPPYYALILRSLTFLEGLALRTDKNYKLLAASYPYMAQRLLTDPSPQLRASLEELILRNGRVRYSRFEQLLSEGVKSKGFSDDAMWLLLEWLSSDLGKNLREPAARELVSLVDGAILTTLRRSADALIPRLSDSFAPLETPADVEVTERAERLIRIIAERTQVPLLGREGVGAFGEGLATVARNLTQSIGPADAVRTARNALQSVRSNSQKLQSIINKPGGREMAQTVASGLAQRGLARAARSFLIVTGGTPDVPGGFKIPQFKIAPTNSSPRRSEEDSRSLSSEDEGPTLRKL